MNNLSNLSQAPQSDSHIKAVEILQIGEKAISSYNDLYKDDDLTSYISFETYTVLSASQPKINPKEIVSGWKSENIIMVFVTVGMGGTEAVKVARAIATEAKRCGMIIVGIATIPSMFEGRLKRIKAYYYIGLMEKSVHSLFVVDNATQYVDKSISTSGALSCTEVGHIIRGITSFIMFPGVLSFDFNDMMHFMKNGGLACLRIIHANKDDNLSNILQQSFANVYSYYYKPKSADMKITFTVSIGNELQKENIMNTYVTDIGDFLSSFESNVEASWTYKLTGASKDSIYIIMISNGYKLRCTKMQQIFNRISNCFFKYQSFSNNIKTK